MTQLKILIADDEKEARNLIRYYIGFFCNPLEIMEASDGKKTLDLLNVKEPDIVFLDVKMPDLTGIEVLQKRERSSLPAIIFTTAFDEHAISAFDHEAVDFLLKPFSKERFQKALEKAVKYVAFIKTHIEKRTYSKTLSAKTGTKTVFIPVEEIEYLEAKDAYVKIGNNSKTILINIPLYKLETLLDPSQFVRVHRTFIINRNYLICMMSLSNGDYILYLKSGKQIRASRTYSSKLK